MTTERKTQLKHFEHFKTAGTKMGKTKIRMPDTAHLQRQGVGQRVHKTHGEKAWKISREQFTSRCQCGMAATKKREVMYA